MKTAHPATTVAHATLVAVKATTVSAPISDDLPASPLVTAMPSSPDATNPASETNEHPTAAPVSSYPSPLTDAFMQAWQHDLAEVRKELLPLQRQVAAQERRLSQQEDLRRDAIGVLIAVGMGLGLLRAASRAWRDISLRRMRAEPALPVTPGQNTASGAADAPEDDARDRPSQGRPPPDGHTAASPPAPRATLDESTHGALYAEVDALRSTGHLDACVALLETALHGEVEQPPGALLRLLDLYRRLDLADAHGRIARELVTLYAVDVPDIGQCSLVDAIDVASARAALLRRRPDLAGRSPAETRQRLGDALLERRAGQAFGWQDFQTALAWQAELGQRDGQVTTMPPAAAVAAVAPGSSPADPRWRLLTG
jgi:hypothetical protein